MGFLDPMKCWNVSGTKTDIKLAIKPYHRDGQNVFKSYDLAPNMGFIEIFITSQEHP